MYTFLIASNVTVRFVLSLTAPLGSRDVFVQKMARSKPTWDSGSSMHSALRRSPVALNSRTLNAGGRSP